MTGAQTFEQDLAFQRWKRCDTFATIALQRIDTDGRVIVTGREPEQAEFLRCMAEQVREQRKSKPNLVAPAAQRASVQRLLAGHPLVERFFDAPPERGGWGATIVVLRP